MGVLACSRLNCDNVMCDRMIAYDRYRYYGRNYICDDCYRELEEYKDTWEPPLTEEEILDKISHFMNNTSPGTYTKSRNEDCDIDEVFRRLVTDTRNKY